MKMLATHRNFFTAVIILFILGAISIFLFTSSYQRWAEMNEHETRVLHNIQHAKFKLAKTHLWFEEMMTGDEMLDKELIFDSIKGSADLIKESIAIERKSSIVDADLIDELGKYGYRVAEFEELARKRWAISEQSGPESELDDFFDDLFDDIINKSVKLEVKIVEHLEGMQKEHDRSFYSFIAGWSFAFLCSFALLISVNKKRSYAEIELGSAYDELASTNKELESVNEEVSAANEELEAINEELTATNEEYDAINEELGAVNIELDATNKDLKDEILEREKVEKDLVRSQNDVVKEKNKLSAILASIGDGISIQDRDYNIIYKNEFYNEIFGPDIIGRKCYEVYEKRDSVCVGCPVMKTFETGEITTATRVGIKENGSKLYVDITASPIRDENDEVVACLEMARDVTSKTLLAKERESLIEDLEYTNRELDAFAHTISHDLKAPLRGIMSLVDWMNKDYRGMLGDEGDERLELLNKRSKRMFDLIDGVLKFSRVGRSMEKMAKLDLNMLVKDVIDMLSIPPGIIVRVENELPVISCKESALEMLFLNLISNAVNHMGRDTGEVRISCTSDHSMGVHTFCISDTGTGIDEENHDSIFELFNTSGVLDDTTGTGIGLSIAKKVVEQCGGEIWLKSKRGEGSNFYFTLNDNCTARTNNG